MRAGLTVVRCLLVFLLGGTVLPPCARAQACFSVRGRAVWWRGDGYFEIWHVGTHHSFFVTDKASTDLVCRYFDCENGERQPALFADFTVCPTKP